MRISQDTLDCQLWQRIREGASDAIYDYCSALAPKYPVCIDFKRCVENLIDYLGNAMILFSGYRGEELGPIVAAAKKMIQQEVCSGRWNAMPADETAAAGVIAQRSFDDVQKTSADFTDPESVYMVIGLYTYASVCCNEGLDSWSFIHLFVLAWFIYYSEKLSMPSVMSQQEGNVRS